MARTKNALKALGLSVMDEEIFNKIEDDDVIEFYSDQGIQIYRNIRFFNFCSYSLLDLAVNSWEDLYQKPASVTERLHQLFHEVLSPNSKFMSYNLGTFIQRERFIYTKTRRTFLVTPKNLSPLINQSGVRSAILSTYKAKIVDEGQTFEII